MRRVAITGLGIISPIGNTLADFWMNLMAGKSGVTRLSLGWPPAVRWDRRPSHARSVKVPVKAGSRRTGPVQPVRALGGVAGDRGRRPAIGTGKSQANWSQHRERHGRRQFGRTSICRPVRAGWLLRVKPSTVLMAMNNAAVAHISMASGLQGPTLTSPVRLRLVVHRDR